MLLLSGPNRYNSGMTHLTATDISYVKKIITEAGQRIEKVQNPITLASKKLGSAAADIVTQTDIDTEHFLRAALTQKFPHIGFYSEESYKTSEDELEKELVWVVDPIDGTLNFSRGLPMYGVSVGLLHNKKPLAGFLYFPKFKNLYWAVKGHGAFRNSQKLSISQRTEIRSAFGGWGIGHIETSKLQQLHAELHTVNVQLLNTYSTIDHLARVAEGAFDFSFVINSGLWDVAGGWAIIEEAGGTLDIFYHDQTQVKKGSPYQYWSIAANAVLVEAIKSYLQKLI